MPVTESRRLLVLKVYLGEDHVSTREDAWSTSIASENFDMSSSLGCGLQLRAHEGRPPCIVVVWHVNRILKISSDSMIHFGQSVMASSVDHV